MDGSSDSTWIRSDPPGVPPIDVLGAHVVASAGSPPSLASVSEWPVPSGLTGQGAPAP
jgi:hypothetical protein